MLDAVETGKVLTDSERIAARELKEYLSVVKMTGGVI
jgi:hypothetical protein